MKRVREADEAAAAHPPADAPVAPASPPSEDDDSPAQPRRPRHAASAACPFLDTVNRSALDFDFEKCCSVTLSPLHCYACLVCGKYFQGRGPATVAYTHALEAGHHVFMKLADGRVYCLPDGYEVLDRSLDDIRHVLDPRFGADALAAVDTCRAWSSALDGSEYLPGVVGLNNVKATDYVNVVLQALMRVKPLRDVMLRRVVGAGGPVRDSPVLQRFGELMRKVWNPRNFKGQVRWALVPYAACVARLQAGISNLRSVSLFWPLAGQPARVLASGGASQQQALPHRPARRPSGVSCVVSA